MKRHLVFCCNYHCLKVEMSKTIEANRPVRYISFSDNVVRAGDDEYRFYSQINDNKEKIYGLLLNDYRTCDNYLIDNNLKFILKTHMGREL